MSLYGRLAPRGPNGLGYGSTAEEATEGLDLSGKTYLVTGCNSGLGLETVRVLRLRGAHVVGTARTRDKAEAAGAVHHGLRGPFTAMACELSEPRSVRACIAEIAGRGLRLDGIIANAGIMALPKLEKAFGYELQFFTNHVGHFLLVTGLLEHLSETARVVVVSSEAHRRAPRETIDWDNLRGERGYDPWGAYGRSKMANILFARQLARRFAGTARTANALHPGVIKTNLGRHMGAIANAGWAFLSPLFFKSIPEGAATQCFVATHPSVASVSGQYFSHCQIARPRPDALDDEKAKKLWEISEQIAAEVG